MKTPVESYVVRIYRCRSGAKRQLVGLIEAPQLAGSQGFTSLEQLWEILSARTLRAKASAKSGDKPRHRGSIGGALHAAGTHDDPVL